MKKIYNKITDCLCSFSVDRYVHFIVCMILVQLISLLIPFYYAMIVAFILGLSKEIYDSNQKDDKFDIKDLFADSLGIVTEGLILMI